MNEVVLDNVQNAESERSSIMPEIQTLKVGLIMPISNTEGYPVGHWNEVRKIIEEALEEIGDYKCKVSMVSEAEDVTLIQKNIIQRIYEDDIVIVDVSSKNPNVMFELGVRFAFDKAFILLKDDSTDYSFDISSIHHINYPKNLRYKDVIEMKSQLKTRLLATYSKSESEESMYLKDFGTYKVASLESTELPMMDYLQKMFSDVKREIREVKPKKVSNYLIEENKIRRKNVLYDAIEKLIKNYSMEKDVDSSELLLNDDLRNLIYNDGRIKYISDDVIEIDGMLKEVLIEMGAMEQSWLK